MNIVLYPHPKINIGLSIVNRRPDGFHDIETLFYPVGNFKDVLEITESEVFSFNRYGNPYPLKDENPENDLCVKAYRLLERDFNLPPVEIHLYKGIPVGAGIGGGSADAACTLKALNRLFGLKLSQERLATYAAQLGSDCPFFIYDTPMIGRGRGEILVPYNNETINSLKEDFSIKIVHPGIHISTAKAYSSVTPHPVETPIEQLLEQPVQEWKKNVTNDFEKPLFEEFPELRRIKESLYNEGALYASMSGSGSALFGLFRREYKK